MNFLKKLFSTKQPEESQYEKDLEEIRVLVDDFIKDMSYGWVVKRIDFRLETEELNEKEKKVVELLEKNIFMVNLGTCYFEEQLKDFKEENPDIGNRYIQDIVKKYSQRIDIVQFWKAMNGSETAFLDKEWDIYRSTQDGKSQKLLKDFLNDIFVFFPSLLESFAYLEAENDGEDLEIISEIKNILQILFCKYYHHFLRIVEKEENIIKQAKEMTKTNLLNKTREDLSYFKNKK